MILTNMCDFDACTSLYDNHMHAHNAIPCIPLSCTVA